MVHSPGPHVLVLVGAPLSEVLCPSSSEPPASPRASPKHPQPNKPPWVLQPSLRSTSGLLPTRPQEGRAGLLLLPCRPQQEGCLMATGASGTPALGGGPQAPSQQGQAFFGAQGCRVSPWKVQRLGPLPSGVPRHLSWNQGPAVRAAVHPSESLCSSPTRLQGSTWHPRPGLGLPHCSWAPFLQPQLSGECRFPGPQSTGQDAVQRRDGLLGPYVTCPGSSLSPGSPC